MVKVSWINLSKMKRCTFLVRGINVGGRNRVVMEKFCHDLEKLGFKNVFSFINSGIFSLIH
ncbi:conserved protein of unknown function [Streptococcus thermophilus]|nr:conserved protein of unknown function [Streptococcus thermophilus]CAD0150136.1 conserved protein of unknown function [Streptococcus thermophilus]